MYLETPALNSGKVGGILPRKATNLVSICKEAAAAWCSWVLNVQGQSEGVASICLNHMVWRLGDVIKEKADGGYIETVD